MKRISSAALLALLAMSPQVASAEAPAEAMVRLWCHAYRAAFDFEGDYRRWVASEFLGILCVDELYQGRLALLLAVDPAAPAAERGSPDLCVLYDFRPEDVA